MTALGQAYAATTVLLAARDDEDPPLLCGEPPTHAPSIWDDLPVIPSGLDEEVPF